jgi:hypothetical protein
MAFPDGESGTGTADFGLGSRDGQTIDECMSGTGPAIETAAERIPTAVDGNFQPVGVTISPVFFWPICEICVICGFTSARNALS